MAHAFLNRVSQSLGSTRGSGDENGKAPFTRHGPTLKIPVIDIREFKIDDATVTKSRLKLQVQVY